MCLCRSCWHLCPGLAVAPTWLALKEHVPVEADKAFKQDDLAIEEVAQAESLEENKGKIAIRQNAVGV